MIVAYLDASCCWERYNELMPVSFVFQSNGQKVHLQRWFSNETWLFQPTNEHDNQTASSIPSVPAYEWNVNSRRVWDAEFWYCRVSKYGRSYVVESRYPPLANAHSDCHRPYVYHTHHRQQTCRSPVLLNKVYGFGNTIGVKVTVGCGIGVGDNSAQPL